MSSSGCIILPLAGCTIRIGVLSLLFAVPFVTVDCLFTDSGVDFNTVLLSSLLIDDDRLIDAVFRLFIAAGNSGGGLFIQSIGGLVIGSGGGCAVNGRFGGGNGIPKK